jgi:hypothetical protein
VATLLLLGRRLRREGRRIRDLIGFSAARLPRDLLWGLLWFVVLQTLFLATIFLIMGIRYGAGMFEAFATVFVDESAMRPPPAVGLPAVLFGVQHLFYAPTTAAMPVFGCAFVVWAVGAGLIVLRQRRLMPMIIAHLLVNLLTSLLSRQSSTLQCWLEGRTPCGISGPHRTACNHREERRINTSLTEILQRSKESSNVAGGGTAQCGGPLHSRVQTVGPLERGTERVLAPASGSGPTEAANQMGANQWMPADDREERTPMTDQVPEGDRQEQEREVHPFEVDSDGVVQPSDAEVAEADRIDQATSVPVDDEDPR